MTRRTWVLLAVLAALIVWLLWCWYGGALKISTSGYTAAPAPREVANLPKKVITSKAEVYKDKKQAMKRLGMSDEDSNDEEEVATAAEIPRTSAGAKSVVFLNHSTGEFRVVVKANPVPLFSFEKGTEIGVRYGFSTGGRAVTLFIRQDFARIGKAYLSAYGEASAVTGGLVSSKPIDAKAMLEVSGRFNRFPGIE